MDEGLDPARARDVVDGIASSPAMRAVDAAMGPVRQAVQLRRAVLRSGSRDVVRIPPDPALYLQGFAAAQTPVLLEGATRHWPAHGWTWPGLRARLGHVEVPAVVGRDSHPDHERRLGELTESTRFDALVDRLLDPSTGNDTYVVARNEAVTTGLAALLDDVPGMDGIVRSVQQGVALWIGAAGAFTAAHRDISTTLLCPVLGRKQVRLAPPEEDIEPSETPLWAEPVDLARDDLAVREVTVEPGDALSIPAGWWHEVRTLEPCILVTLAHLELSPNRFDWLRG